MHVTSVNTYYCQLLKHPTAARRRSTRSCPCRRGRCRRGRRCVGSRHRWTQIWSRRRAWYRLVPAGSRLELGTGEHAGHAPTFFLGLISSSSSSWNIKANMACHAVMIYCISSIVLTHHTHHAIQFYASLLLHCICHCFAFGFAFTLHCHLQMQCRIE